MSRRICLLLAGSLATTVLLLSVDQGRAEPQLTTQSPAPAAQFRDPANVLPTRKTTNEQRQEAAKRAAARRAAAAGTITTTPTTATPEKTEGGTK